MFAPEQCRTCWLNLSLVARELLGHLWKLRLLFARTVPGRGKGPPWMTGDE